MSKGEQRIRYRRQSELWSEWLDKEVCGEVRDMLAEGGKDRPFEE